MRMIFNLTGAALAVIATAIAGQTANAQQSPDAATITAAQSRAAGTVKAMHTDEKTVLTRGFMPIPFDGVTQHLPADAIPAAGYVPGIARLAVPPLRETDASLGVAYIGGLRHDGATALPSGLAQAASWNPEVLYRGGQMIGAEAHAKGFNVLLAGGVNLTRDPRNGRTFEYLSEDPLLSGQLVGAAIRGIQSNHIISTIKHFALNGQETARKFVDTRISEAAARESDLLAFEIGIEQGQPLSVMCSYNLINGAHGCDQDWTLNTVLKHDWHWKGFVMSDWSAVTAVANAMHGLDQESAGELDPQVYFTDQLAAKAKADAAWARRVDDMNQRILTAIYAGGLDRDPAVPGGKIDYAADAAVAYDAALQGIVLLKNAGNILPLAKTAKRIAVIGGYANSGVLSGGGSSQVDAPGGPAVIVPLGGTGPWAAFSAEHYHNSSPLNAITKLAPQAQVTYRSGWNTADAVEQAKRADVVIVFATKWSTEGNDQADLTLPQGQDAMIAAVAAANPHTVVVLETGNPVDMPWLGAVPAVVEAWYPGARGGDAIASVLFGDTNPSGHLPITFPASTDQLPRKAIDGYADLEPSMMGSPPVAGMTIKADYDIEGSDVGYRWFARTGRKPLFPFGFGLSYTTFAGSGLAMANAGSGLSARLSVANTGTLAGATVAQLYLTARGSQARQRLVGYARVELKPGEAKPVALTVDPRLLADWTNQGWSIKGGTYSFALGTDADHLGSPVTVTIPSKTWKD